MIVGTKEPWRRPDIATGDDNMHRIDRGKQLQTLERVERAVVDIAGPESHARDSDDSESRILPADPFAGRGVAKVVATRAALEPETEPLSHPATLRAVAVPATARGLSPRPGASGHGNCHESVTFRPQDMARASCFCNAQRRSRRWSRRNRTARGVQSPLRQKALRTRASSAPPH